MPKVKKGKKAGEKAKEKKNANKEKKVKVDKTFGMKNKGGAQNSRRVAHYKKGQEQNEKKNRRQNKRKAARREKFAEESLMGSYVGRVGGVKKGHEHKMAAKAANEKKKAEEAGLETQPKVQICKFFAKGMCRRGAKCPKSHDLAVLNDATKNDNIINVYEDRRDTVAKTKDDGMENWTREELESVINSRQKGRKARVDKICRYFIAALEKRQYGYRWKCPNGDECMYKHALPLGYVLQDKNSKANQIDNHTSLEEGLEKMQKQLIGRTDLTPVTKETFLKWKETWIRRADEEKKKAEKEAKKKRGKNKQLSGKALFSFDPTMFQTADDDADLTALIEQMPKLSDDEEEIRAKPVAQEIKNTTEETNLFVGDESLFMMDDFLLDDDELLGESKEEKPSTTTVIIENNKKEEKKVEKKKVEKKVKKKKKKKKDKTGGESDEGTEKKKKKKKKKKKENENTTDATSSSNKPKAEPKIILAPNIKNEIQVSDPNLFTDKLELPDLGGETKL